MIVATLIFLVVTATPAPIQRPDVLVIVADDMGWYDLDNIPTPNIDHLASRGVSFKRVWGTPFCSPTRHSIQFGRHPGRDDLGGVVSPQGAPGKPDVDNPGSPFANLSLAELTKAAGYATGFFGKWHLSNGIAGVENEAPRVHGYDTARAASTHNLQTALGVGGYYDWLRVDDGVESYEPAYATRAQADALIEWIQETPAPRFACLAFNAPHKPFVPPPPDLLPPGYSVGRKWRELYEAMVIAMDRKIGDVLASIDLDRTTVFFVTDNGTPVAGPDQDPTKLKGTLFEGGINVPLIVSGWGVENPGRESMALMSTVDIFATIADLTGARIPPTSILDSVSFYDLLRRPKLKVARKFISSENFEPNGPGPKEVRRTAVRNGRFKLIVVDADGDGPQPDRKTMYDLRNDPTESAPLGSLTPLQKVAYADLLEHLRYMDEQF